MKPEKMKRKKNNDEERNFTEILVKKIQEVITKVKTEKEVTDIKPQSGRGL